MTFLVVVVARDPGRALSWAAGLFELVWVRQDAFAVAGFLTDQPLADTVRAWVVVLPTPITPDTGEILLG